MERRQRLLTGNIQSKNILQAFSPWDGAGATCIVYSMSLCYFFAEVFFFSEDNVLDIHDLVD